MSVCSNSKAENNKLQHVPMIGVNGPNSYCIKVELDPTRNKL